MFYSTKTYGHELGFSCSFRNHKATHSHCSRDHGYPLAFRLKFGAEELDKHGWVLDFGALSVIRDWLRTTFDHTHMIATDDPAFTALFEFNDIHDMFDLRPVKAVGCEAFAKMTYDYVDEWLKLKGHAPRVHLVEVEVREHGANSAIYEAPK